ncbi:class I SAM-dependent methyltransferase [Amycolatopsis sp. FDAARGOS 1241]|uniref:class I SAM-dependent methyltransferase n=1 Tax=Amycolatopsis sp. FDAARGOS 1241 TaxID=2778070 RepID=UPI001952407E|nr:class I SAM-dependent methyltransferase [Amycolatopsis sp. FDAARGOS 1241]QRP44183.1 class I SAM-dependent methyltransferase [Amycolatopsis sp. FDAARGOS 1241]
MTAGSAFWIAAVRARESERADRLFDDPFARELAGERGLRQVVLHGAGLDTRTYRLDLPTDADWYEMGRAKVFAAKEPVLAVAAARCRRHPVVADLAADRATPLRDTGFTPGAPTLWLAENCCTPRGTTRRCGTSERRVRNAALDSSPCAAKIGRRVQVWRTRRASRTRRF